MADEDKKNYYSILTLAGQASIANAIALGTKINFTKMKVGDGNGQYYEPDEKQTDLVHTVWEGNITQVSVDDDNPNWIHIEVIIPSTIGGFYIREYGVYDDNDNLLGVCKAPETYKPVISDGSVKEMMLDMVLCVVNTDVVELKIDPTVIYAKKTDIIRIENKIANIEWTRAMGTQNELLVPITGDLYDLLNRTFIAKYDNDNTKTTTINGKNVYKANSKDNVTLKKGKAYTVWYDKVGDCFFLKASATGDARPEDVLAGKTCTTDEGEIIGTMLPFKTHTEATAIPDDIRKGKTAWVNGVKITGTNDFKYEVGNTVSLAEITGGQVYGNEQIDNTWDSKNKYIGSWYQVSDGYYVIVYRESSGSSGISRYPKLIKFNSSLNKLWEYDGFYTGSNANNDYFVGLINNKQLLVQEGYKLTLLDPSNGSKINSISHNYPNAEVDINTNTNQVAFFDKSQYIKLYDITTGGNFENELLFSLSKNNINSSGIALGDNSIYISLYDGTLVRKYIQAYGTNSVGDEEIVNTNNVAMTNSNLIINGNKLYIVGERSGKTVLLVYKNINGDISIESEIIIDSYEERYGKSYYYSKELGKEYLYVICSKSGYPYVYKINLTDKVVVYKKKLNYGSLSVGTYGSQYDLLVDDRIYDENGDLDVFKTYKQYILLT